MLDPQSRLLSRYRTKHRCILGLRDAGRDAGRNTVPLAGEGAGDQERPATLELSNCPRDYYFHSKFRVELNCFHILVRSFFKKKQMLKSK